MFVQAVHADSNETGDQNAVLTLGRACANDFHNGHTDALWPRMSKEMQQALGSAAALKQFREQTGASLGEETELVHEHDMRKQDYRVYSRIARYSKTPSHIELACVFDSKDQIAGFFIKPAHAQEPAPTAYLDYQTKAKLQLPFTGEWYAFWGGRTAEQNYHVINRGQRFAYDLLVLRDGSSYRGDASKKENYYCWNQPILAPAAGTVTEVVTELPDNEPGQTDPAHAAGNHVMLDLGNQEYALLAHLQHGSVQVKVGDKVSSGQLLGRCGNSGNTSEPHLHFHLQNAAHFGEGDGLPAFFNNYLADGNKVARGEPLRGQKIAPITN
ncbi:M23 family metallopeptidase [Permianibacter sp. IMCC34836]|nr:M23 family metallopeptidase [Permianibacter fluminis]